MFIDYFGNKHFKYEELHVAMMMFKQGEWMYSFDLKSGYHHVDVVKCHRKYCTWVLEAFTRLLCCHFDCLQNLMSL